MRIRSVLSFEVDSQRETLFRPPRMPVKAPSRTSALVDHSQVKAFTYYSGSKVETPGSSLLK